MKKVFHKILLIINIILGVALLISYLSVRINPSFLAFPAFFGLAYPYLLLGNILMVIAWGMMLRLEALISVGIIIIGINNFSNYLKLFKSKADKSQTFKVMSYNVNLFNYLERKGSATTIFNLIKSEKPDIVCMQEFFTENNPAKIQSTINAITGMKYQSHVKLVSGRNGYYGIAMFSRFPIVKRGEIVHPGSSSLTTFTDIVIQKDTFRLYNNYLQSFRLKRMERSFISEMTAEDKETLSEMRNIYSRLKRGFVSRARQARNLRDHIRKSPYPVIVAGDFNDTPVSFAYRTIRKGLNDSFVNSGYGAGFTYRGNYPPNRIDYVLYDNSLENKYFEIVRVKYSDHYPVISYFRKKA